MLFLFSKIAKSDEYIWYIAMGCDNLSGKANMGEGFGTKWEQRCSCYTKKVPYSSSFDLLLRNNVRFADEEDINTDLRLLGTD